MTAPNRAQPNRAQPNRAQPNRAQPNRAQQLTLGAMPTRLFGCTPSRLAAFDCPRRYRMTYLDRPSPSRGAPWAHNTLGAVVHLALHRWWSLRRIDRTPSAGGDLVERNWQRDGFRDEPQSVQWRSRARRWVEDYLAADVDAADEPVGVERTVATTTSTLAVSGRVDRIDDRDGELVVVDYKTGRSTPATDDARGSLALALYVLGTRRTMRRSCRRVELHHVATGTVASFDHTQESLARHVARAEATAEDIVAATDTLAAGAHPDEVFPPVPTPACRWCDVRRHCPEGQAASVTVSSWSGLADVDDGRGASD